MARNDWTKLEERLVGTNVARGRLLVGLDFDGVLSEITPHPADATLSRRTAKALKELSGRGDTRLAVLSGRRIGELQKLVGLSGIYYSGNHGLQIEGPGIQWTHPEANAVDRALWQTLVEELKAIPGALVEHKSLGAAVHYRQVAPSYRRRLQDIVRDSLRGLGPRFRIMHGKKIYDLRSSLDWDKGRALAMIQERLEDAPSWNALFIGDDTTDEEAFRTLGPYVLTVRVGRVSRSNAQYVIPRRPLVDYLLEELAARPGPSAQKSGADDAR